MNWQPYLFHEAVNDLIDGDELEGFVRSDAGLWTSQAGTIDILEKEIVCSVYLFEGERAAVLVNTNTLLGADIFWCVK